MTTELCLVGRSFSAVKLLYILYTDEALFAPLEVTKPTINNGGLKNTQIRQLNVTFNTDFV